MQALPKPDKAQLIALSANNRTATLQTLKLMWGLTNEGRLHNDIRHLALQIVADLPSKAYKLETEAIYNWVANNIRYTLDIDGIETLQTPDWTLKLRQGDCDDHAILVASLLRAIGHKVKFVAIKDKTSGSKNYCHVYAITKIGPHWVSVDTTEAEHGMGYIDPRSYEPIFFSR